MPSGDTCWTTGTGHAPEQEQRAASVKASCRTFSRDSRGRSRVIIRIDTLAVIFIVAGTGRTADNRQLALLFRTYVESSTAMMIADDSISTSATAM
jgi:hypothetical protein